MNLKQSRCNITIRDSLDGRGSDVNIAVLSDDIILDKVRLFNLETIYGINKAGIKDSPSYGTLRGNVKDYDTGANLQGVSVAVFDRRIVKGSYVDRIAGRKSTSLA